MEIRRKPVAAPSCTRYGVVPRPRTPHLQAGPGPAGPPPPYSVQPAAPLSTTSLQPPRALPRHRSHPNLGSSYNASPPISPAIPRAETSLPPPPPPGQSTPKPSFYADTRHFLGGLIHHPSESTKHYSILRHSHGVVFYRGPTTSVDVSIFSDAALPADRSLWLQPKGWSGKTGMRAKALLHLHDDWIDVSPSLAVRAEQLEPATERAWQRDITKFRKKAAARIRDSHHLRETVVARVPPDAGDGYFQLVLCHGNKKVLCRSPVFRLLSTSASPSSLRGASLTSMPLEVGAMVLGMYAQAAAQTVLAPVTAAMQSKIQPYQPGWLTTAAATTAAATAYSTTGLEDRVSSARDASAADPGGQQLSIENGPQPPFPMDVAVRPSHPLDRARVTVKLAPGIADQLHGFFFGWARPANNHPWQPAILSVRPWDPSQTRGAPISLSQTAHKAAALRLLDETLPAPLPPTYSVRILGFLRPDMAPSSSPRTAQDLIAAREAAAEAALLADQCDAEYAQGILDHPMWGAEVTPAQRQGWLARTRTGVDSVKTRGQRMAERVGIRSGLEGGSSGGYYIPR